MSAGRQEEIRFLLQEHGHLTVTQLAERFHVSEMTIRRDLKTLASLGFIQREHGGAVYPQEQNPLFLNRLGEAEREKTWIGRKAANLIEEGESIIIDAGTTTLAVAHALSKKCVVITNSLPIAGVLGTKEEVTVIMTGGEIRGNTYALVGPLTRASLAGLNADKLFLAATGVNLDRGLSTANMLENEVKQAMLSRAKQVILVADSSKIGKVFYHTFAYWDKIHTFVTDSNFPDQAQLSLEEKGVRVIIAPMQTRDR